MNSRLMVKISMVIYLLMLTMSAGQDYWSRTYGSRAEDIGFTIIQTADSGFIVAGGSNSFCNYGMDMWVIKMDASGNIQWEKTYGRCEGFLQDEKARSIKETPDGGYIIAGSLYSASPVGSDVWVVKIDNRGAIQWQKTYGGQGEEEAYSVQLASDGGYIIASVTSSFGSGSADIWIFKIDDKGAVQWQKTYGNATYEEPCAMAKTSDNHFVITGYVNIAGLKSDPVLIKIDEQGTVKWQKRYSAYECDRAFAVDSFDDGFVLAGYTASNSQGGRDFLIMKIDLSGNIEWQKAVGGKEHEEAYSVKKTSDGDYLIAGNTQSYGAGMYDLWIIKLDAKGTLLWEKTYGGKKNDYGKDMLIVKNGSFVIAGSTESYGSQSADLWLLKLDKKGNISHSGSCCLVSETTAGISYGSLETFDYDARSQDVSCMVKDIQVLAKDSSATSMEQCSLDIIHEIIYFPYLSYISIIEPASCSEDVCRLLHLIKLKPL